MKTSLVKAFVGGILLLLCLTAKAQERWFPKYDLDVVRFGKAEKQFAPFVRWWWPGNDVTELELRREIDIFAENGFGGVEIQPFTINIPNVPPEQRGRIQSWDTPDYYRNIRAVMEQARERELTVDMNNGSGWPAGGAHIAPEDGFLNLVHESVSLPSGKDIAIALPKLENETGAPVKLVTVLAVKSSGLDTLDATSTIVLTERVRNDSLYWRVPEGKWKALVFYSKPNSRTGSMTAAPKQGPVLNHLDSTKVIKSLNHLFGSRTGLEEFYGTPLRAVFDDSYEFTVDRHFVDNFIDYFKQVRGYDITPWLPVNMARRYNYVSFKNPNAEPDFHFSPQDWRIRYDYDLTISELFADNFITASRHWLESRGMLHRTQSYGMKLDMIANAGRASIPETESMLGSELNLKVVTSGAHLYNRPLISAESVVFSNRGYMTSPQKIRLAVDKLFAAGVNHIIYHGVPYRYFNEKTTSLGWYPFYLSPTINFSTHIGEGTNYWKYQKEINDYIARTQYVLRSGKATADVLIYLSPFVEGMPANQHEIMTNGYIEGVEPPLPEQSKLVELPIHEIVNRLEANGISWDWVNDESILAATFDSIGQIDVRGNKYQSLMIVNEDYIPLPVAEQINALAQKGMNLIVVGNMPGKQPSFINWKENDKLTEAEIKDAVGQKNAHYTSSAADITEWIGTIHLPLKYTQEYKFARQSKRLMSDGSVAWFIWNTSNNWQSISLSADDKFNTKHIFDAASGDIYAFDSSFILPPYSSLIVFASINGIDKSPVTNNPLTPYGTKLLSTIERWDITAGNVKIKNTLLYDLKDDKILGNSSTEATYKATFTFEKSESQTYFIDLGKVCFTADVAINGQNAGLLIFAPYSLDITPYLHQGENTIEVRVMPTELNGLIGEAAKGNVVYRAFSGAERMSAGLIGPVTILTKQR